MTTLSKEINCLMAASRPFALATVIGHKGSTPRTSGSRMLVRQDKTIAGTIGGGLVEARVMEACAAMLDAPSSKVMDFTLDNEIKADMDMICGGGMTLWLRSFVPPFSQELVRTYQSMAGLESKRKKILIITRVTGGRPGDPVLVSETAPDQAAALLPKALMADISDSRFSGPGPFRQCYGLDEYMVETISPGDTLYIFGAGHVGFQLGRLAHTVDFSTVVIDDREEFADPDRFPHARQVLAVPEFASAFERLDIDGHSYIAILTRGHLHDQTVLAQALDTRAAYIGMIGSGRKRKQIYANLMEKGVDRAALEAVHSPIGTEIMAETPAEIAVSIVGELILERARRKGTPAV